jgi:methyltransferase-like protein
MDFVRNRMFRQTLLCHQQVALDRSVPATRVLGLYVASPAKPEAPVGDVRSNAKVVFRGKASVTTTTDPMMKAAFLHLGDVWPQAVSFSELLAVARSKLSPEPVVVDTAHATVDARRLAEPLIRCYATTQVEFSVQPSPFAATVSERPRTSRYIRSLAETSNTVTDLRHCSVKLSDLQRHLLRFLDGDTDRNGLLEKVADLVAANVLVVRENGQRVENRDRIKSILDKPLQQSLETFAKFALLTA